MSAKFNGPELELPGHLKRALAAGHPWVYRDHVPRGFRAPAGTWVRIRSGNFSAYALWDETSPIALRVFSEHAVPDAAWVAERVHRAKLLRDATLPADTSAFRLIFGEADGLPGATVDVYGQFAVILTYADALDAIVPWLSAALLSELAPHGVLRRSRDADGATPRLELLAGRMPPRELTVSEHGHRLIADLYAGQKSGLFLDHRENRRYLAGLAAGKRVLNLFSYTGAFSLYAAQAGASSVTSVDSAEPATLAAQRNFELNGLDPTQHEFITEDVFAFLERARRKNEKFELVICDPPSFARSHDQLKQALRAYVSLNSAALRICEIGGIYAAASCTAQVSPEAFRGVLAEAACNAKRRFQIFHDAGHASDHPVLAGHPEGRYLKFMVGRVEAVP